jgi:hypothetical protein
VTDMHSHYFNRRIKNLRKLFDVIKAHAKLIFHQRIAITL